MSNGCNESGAAPKKVPLAEAARTLQRDIEAADPARAQQLTGLAHARRAKGAGLAREQARLREVLGPEHPRVAALQEKLTSNETLTTQVQRAAARSAAAVPQADADTWVVHGHVRTREFQPVAQVTLGLYTPDGLWLRPFGHDCTDADGHFKLCVKAGGAPANTADTTGVADLASATRQVFLRVTDGAQRLLGVDTAPLTPRPGQVDYREIILDGKVCTPPEGDAEPATSARSTRSAPVPSDNKASRFLGNASTHEVHDMKNAKNSCQIDEIAADRRVLFKSAEDAVKAGYDYCAHCFGKAKSKR